MKPTSPSSPRRRRIEPEKAVSSFQFRVSSFESELGRGHPDKRPVFGAAPPKDLLPQAGPTAPLKRNCGAGMEPSARCSQESPRSSLSGMSPVCTPHPPIYPYPPVFSRKSFAYCRLRVVKCGKFFNIKGLRVNSWIERRYAIHRRRCPISKRVPPRYGSDLRGVDGLALLLTSSMAL